MAIVREALRRTSIEQITLIAACVLLVVGARAPTDLYLAPESGLGYALGIAGGTMMLLLLVYPARKRIHALAFIGSVSRWFRAHMLLGIVGPLCILFHSNFSLGATNSNVALVCMLVVAGSGIVGRYLYSKIHHGLFGRKATLADLQARAEQLKSQNPALPMLPELIARVEAEERSLTARRTMSAAAPLLMSLRTARARRRLRLYVRPALRAAAARSPALAAQRERVERAVMGYVTRRLDASRRVRELAVYERLFSLWHVLHLPLFFMLLAAGIVHVIAVHVY